MTQELQLPEVQALQEAVQQLARRVEELCQKLHPMKLWYSRAELAGLKGIPVSAFYNKPWLLPGKPHKQAGDDRWSYGQVWDSGWIWKSDVQLTPKNLKPKEGKAHGTGVEAGSEDGNARPQAPVLRVLGQRRGARS